MNAKSMAEGLMRNSIAPFAPFALGAFAIGIVLVVSIGCGSSEPDARTEAQADVQEAQPSQTSTRAKRKARVDRHQVARRRALAWLDQLEVDPVALIARGVKGKKKLGEAVGAYLYLLRYSTDPIERSLLSDRLRELGEQTARPEYHNMRDCDRREFNQNSMSYLRVAWLLEQAGWDTTDYRAQIESIRPRLDRSLVLRKPKARVQFAWYYEHFGWPLPAGAQQQNEAASIIGKRTPVGAYQRRSIYTLTHEISFAFHFGLRQGSDAFDRSDLAYLRRVLAALTIRFSRKKGGDPDIVAELVSSMTYLGFDNIPAYQTGVEFLLRSQNPNGSWGDHEDQRSKLGDDVDVKLYLHTTMVTLRALLESNDRAWKKSFAPAD